jgi:hypothetical protein
MTAIQTRPVNVEQWSVGGILKDDPPEPDQIGIILNSSSVDARQKTPRASDPN